MITRAELAVIDEIAHAIAEGRYEPDDPREVNPHASTRPHKPHKPIGPLIYDIIGRGECDPGKASSIPGTPDDYHRKTRKRGIRGQIL